mgnify:CR=1 FL=1
MSRPFVLVTGPVAEDAALVARLISESKGLRHRAGIRLGGVLELMEAQLHARDGLDRTNGGRLPEWVQAAVADYLGLVPTLQFAGLAVVDAPELWHRPELLARLSNMGVVVAVLDDPRRGRSDTDPEAAIRWGRRWAESVADVVSRTTRGRWLTLRLWRPDAHAALAALVQQLSGQPLRARLSSRPPLAWSPTQEAALRAHTAVDPALLAVGLPLPPKAPGCPHPAIALARAEAALQAGRHTEAWEYAGQAGHGLSAALLQSRLYRVAGKASHAVEALRPFLDGGRGPDDARVEALRNPTTALSEDVAAAVVPSDSEAVRTALARWLLAHGMDPEAAELVAWVEGTGWHSGVRTRA